MRRLMLFVFISSTISMFSQNNVDISLKINSFNYEGDTILLGINIFNQGRKDIICYKIGTHDICFGLLKIKAQNDVADIHEVYLCDKVFDIEPIHLNYNNSVKLHCNEGFIKVFKLSVKDFVPYLTKGSYELFVEVNFSIANFETELENVLEIDLLSDKYNFSYK